MTEPTDKELNLAVAKVMYPDYDWSPVIKGVFVIGYNSYHQGKSFDFRNKHCAFDMNVWLAKQYDMTQTEMLGTYSIVSLLTAPNPQRALALAIKEKGDSDGV